MRTSRLAAAAVLATAVTGLAAPAAMAATDTFGFSVSPGTVAPGGMVTLNAHGCQVPTVTVSSGIFNTVTLNEGRPATVKVDADAKPGAQYTVTFNCNGKTGTANLMVSSLAPVGPVKTGLGGGNSGMDAAELAGGAALLAAVAGAVVVRRRAGDNA